MLPHPTDPFIPTRAALPGPAQLLPRLFCVLQPHNAIAAKCKVREMFVSSHKEDEGDLMHTCFVMRLKVSNLFLNNLTVMKPNLTNNIALMRLSTSTCCLNQFRSLFRLI